MEDLKIGKLHLPLVVLQPEYRKTKQRQREKERENVNDCVWPEAHTNFWSAYQLSPTN